MEKATVALFTRAWIEIAASFATSSGTFVALFTRAWIEIIIDYNTLSPICRRPLHEGVD